MEKENKNEKYGKYAEYIGKGYYGKIRKKITVDETLLPDSIIDADANIGAMKRLVAPVLETMKQFGKFVNTDKKFLQFQEGAINLLCGILCVALKSRTSAPPYDKPECQRHWDKKREKFIRMGNAQLMELMRMG
jgi:hypothetical protein